MITLGSTPIGQLPPIITGATPSVVNANAKFGSIPDDCRSDRPRRI